MPLIITSHALAQRDVMMAFPESPLFLAFAVISLIWHELPLITAILVLLLSLGQFSKIRKDQLTADARGESKALDQLQSHPFKKITASVGTVGSLVFLCIFTATMISNHTIRSYVEHNDYHGLKAYLADCHVCRWSISADDAIFSASPIIESSSYQQERQSEILALLCQHGGDCKNINVTLTVLKHANLDFLDDYLAHGEKPGYSSDEWTYYISLVTQGQPERLRTLLEHKLKAEHPSDPQLDLLNIAIQNPHSQQWQIIKLLRDAGASARGIPPAYVALIDSYRQSSIAPLVEKHIGKKELLTEPTNIHSTGIRPLWLALNWPQQRGWIEKIIHHTGLDTASILKAAKADRRCGGVINALARNSASFEDTNSLYRKYCY